ncbi:hypothetical protein HDF23_005670 [Mucilaginibacter lappiensis]|uniref:Glycosyltransferase subfamily 4-like N-terminal domain-containing protein n=1 Tax=Mucilaginibacter lappiensis TaxID=354630 RepID=A0ABR6PSX3_9SPHI|nr:hypothetical protein [Mucilaginibacter lappiensis]MBB6112887.1 hypothetical protein [Mucilaginibacter lappiensis]
MRIASLIGYLQHHVQLTVVITGPAPNHIEEFLRRDYKAEFYVPEYEKYLNSNGYGKRLKAFLKDRHFDAIVIEYIHSSYFLNFLMKSDALIIFDAHDIISDRINDFKKFDFQGALFELTRESEFDMHNLYDYVKMLCVPDFEKIKLAIGANKILLCPHPIIPFKHTTRKDVGNIVFIASAYLPNKDASYFFINNCWPGILLKYDVRLSIYGTVCDGLVIEGAPSCVVS